MAKGDLTRADPRRGGTRTIRLGLASIGFTAAKAGRQSGDFGVLEPAQKKSKP
jgi:hypothetical protein